MGRFVYNTAIFRHGFLTAKISIFLALFPRDCVITPPPTSLLSTRRERRAQIRKAFCQFLTGALCFQSIVPQIIKASLLRLRIFHRLRTRKQQNIYLHITQGRAIAQHNCIRISRTQNILLLCFFFFFYESHATPHDNSFRSFLRKLEKNRTRAGKPAFKKRNTP